MADDAQFSNAEGVLQGSEFNLTVNVEFPPPSVTVTGFAATMVNPFASLSVFVRVNSPVVPL